jgi:hypothetical protein
VSLGITLGTPLGFAFSLSLTLTNHTMGATIRWRLTHLQGSKATMKTIHCSLWVIHEEHRRAERVRLKRLVNDCLILVVVLVVILAPIIVLGE